jgi:hypothetical protein
MEKNISGAILLLRLDRIAALLQVEVTVLLTDQIGKEFTQIIRLG